MNVSGEDEDEGCDTTSSIPCIPFHLLYPLRYDIVGELTEYTRDINPRTAREAVKAVGRIALSVSEWVTAWLRDLSVSGSQPGLGTSR